MFELPTQETNFFVGLTPNTSLSLNSLTLPDYRAQALTDFPNTDAAALAVAQGGGPIAAPAAPTTGGQMTENQFNAWLLGTNGRPGALQGLSSLTLPQGVTGGDMTLLTRNIAASVSQYSRMASQGSSLAGKAFSDISGTTGQIRTVAGNVGSLAAGVGAAFSLFSGHETALGAVRDGTQVLRGAQTTTKLVGSNLQILGQTASNVLGVVAGGAAAVSEALAIKNSIMPDSTAGKAAFVGSAALGGIGTAIGIQAAIHSATALATGGVAAATAGGIGGALSSTLALCTNPLTIGIGAALACTQVIVGIVRANHRKNDSSVMTVDKFSVGAQYISNPGRENIDPGTRQEETMFNDGLKAMGLTADDLSDKSTKFSAQQRMAIRSIIAQKYGDPSMAICFNDMQALASEQISKAPPDQRQALFNQFVMERMSLADAVVGNPFQPKPEGQKDGDCNWGMMQTSNACTSQYNWTQITLNNMAKSLGVKFITHYSGDLDDGQKKAISA